VSTLIIIFSVWVVKFRLGRLSGSGSPSLAWQEKRGDSIPTKAIRRRGKVFIMFEIEDIPS
jgi:hypothetical protein